MLPKNVRQIGIIEGNKRIYIEDYVMTYARKIEGMAVLLGKIEKEEQETIFYINGAVSVPNVEFGYPVILKNEDWSQIYGDVKNYFADSEIMGWLLVRKDVVLEIDENIRRTHEENFKDSNKILFLYDKGEKEEAFYLSGIMGDLKKQSGFYIYYEKNDAMQNYMIDKNPEEKVEENFQDDAMEKVREIISQKEAPKADKKIVNLMYGASTLLAAVVLVIGATMLDNYDKMKNMEQTLNLISDTLGEEGENDVVEVEKIIGNTMKTEDNTTGITDLEQDKKVVPGETKGPGDIDNENENKDAAAEGKHDKSDIEDNEAAQTEPTEKDDTDKKEDTKTDKKNNTDKKEDAKTDETEKTGEKPEKKDDVQEEKPVSAQASAEYTVQEGDTLASISLRFYRSYSYVEKIREENAIEDGDKILAGQVLKLPEK